MDFVIALLIYIPAGFLISAAAWALHGLAKFLLALQDKTKREAAKIAADTDLVKAQLQKSKADLAGKEAAGRALEELGRQVASGKVPKPGPDGIVCLDPNCKNHGQPFPFSATD